MPITNIREDVNNIRLDGLNGYEMLMSNSVSINIDNETYDEYKELVNKVFKKINSSIKVNKNKKTVEVPEEVYKAIVEIIELLVCF